MSGLGDFRKAERYAYLRTAKPGDKVWDSWSILPNTPADIDRRVSLVMLSLISEVPDLWAYVGSVKQNAARYEYLRGAGLNDPVWDTWNNEANGPDVDRIVDELILSKKAKQR